MDLDFISTVDAKYKIEIDRRIEPDSLRVFDVLQNPKVELNEDGLSDEMYVLSCRGDEFFFDKVDPQTREVISNVRDAEI